MGLFDFMRQDQNQPVPFDPALLGAPGGQPSALMPPPQPQAMAPAPMPDFDMAEMGNPQGFGALGPPPGPQPDLDMAEMGNPAGFGSPGGGPARMPGVPGGPPSNMPMEAPKKLGLLGRLGRAIQSDDWDNFAIGLQEMGGNTAATAERRAQLGFEQNRRVQRQAKEQMDLQSYAAREAMKGGKGWNQGRFEEVMGGKNYDPDVVQKYRDFGKPNERLIADKDGNQWMVNMDTLEKRRVIKASRKPIRVMTEDGPGWMMPPEDDDGTEPAPAGPGGPPGQPPAPAQAPIPMEAQAPAQVPDTRPRAAAGGITPSSFTPADRQGLIDMIATEARGEGEQGMLAAGHVAMNRLKAGHMGAKSLRDVVTAKSQFEGMKNAPFLSAAQKAEAGRVADMILSGQGADPTNGAVNFINKQMQTARGGKIPSWAQGQGQQIGQHTFFGGKAPAGVMGGIGEDEIAEDDDIDEIPEDDEEGVQGAWGGDEEGADEADVMTDNAGAMDLRGGAGDDPLPPGYTWLVKPSGGKKKDTYHPATADELKAVGLPENSSGFQTSSTGQIGRIPNLGKPTDPAKIEAQKAATQRGVVQANAMIGNVDEITKSITHGISWGGPKGQYIPWTSPQAGMLGGVLANFNETEARAIRGKLDTLKANLAWEKLQAMRDASPTGGALGQVSEMELRLLASSVANLDQGLSPDELKSNLNDVRNHFQNWLEIQKKAGIDVDAITKSTLSEGGASKAPKGSVVVGGKRYDPGKVYEIGGKRLKRTETGWLPQ